MKRNSALPLFRIASRFGACIRRVRWLLLLPGKALYFRRELLRLMLEADLDADQRPGEDKKHRYDADGARRYLPEGLVAKEAENGDNAPHNEGRGRHLALKTVVPDAVEVFPEALHLLIRSLPHTRGRTAR